MKSWISGTYDYEADLNPFGRDMLISSSEYTYILSLHHERRLWDPGGATECSAP